MVGTLLWTDTLYTGDLLNEHDVYDCFRSSPQLLDSIAYIGSEEGLVIGVNVKTGERVFQAQTLQADVTIETTPAIHNNKIYVGDWLGVLSVFDLNTQDLVWQYDTKDDNTYSWVNSIVSQPLIYRDTLYFGGRNCNLYAFNPETGERLWMYHQPGNMWLFGGPVVSDDVLYVGSSFQQVLYAFSPDEPELLWENGVYGLNYGYPVIHDDFILVGTGSTTTTNSGSLTIVNKQSHEMEERFNVDGWVETPLYHKGIIYFGCGNGNIYAINEQSLLNTLRPNIILKDGNNIDLGQLPNTGSFDTSFYLYNVGEGEDSLTKNMTAYSYATVEPESIILPASDSAEISVTIDLSALSEGNKSLRVKYQSHNSLIQQTELVKMIVFEIVDEPSDDLYREPIQFSIEQNHPNPVTGRSTVQYSVGNECFVQLNLYDILGNKVAILVNEIKLEGNYIVEFDASDLQNGTYFYVFSADTIVLTRKMMVIN